MAVSGEHASCDIISLINVPKYHHMNHGVSNNRQLDCFYISGVKDPLVRKVGIPLDRFKTLGRQHNCPLCLIARNCRHSQTWETNLTRAYQKHDTILESHSQPELEISQTDYECIIQSCKFACSSYVEYNDEIRSQFCTCHNSLAVVTCANLWPDFIIIFINKSEIFSKDFSYELISGLDP